MGFKADKIHAEQLNHIAKAAARALAGQGAIVVVIKDEPEDDSWHSMCAAHIDGTDGHYRALMALARSADKLINEVSGGRFAIAFIDRDTGKAIPASDDTVEAVYEDFGEEAPATSEEAS